jgi:hypothetical protein
MKRRTLLAALNGMLGGMASVRAAAPAWDDRDRIGCTHVAGLYHHTTEPFLLEGARRLLDFGTRAGKFWFTPASIARSYPWHHEWPATRTLVDLARTDAFTRLFALPFRTIALEAQIPFDDGRWRAADMERHLAAHEEAFFALGDHLLRAHGQRDVTFILQNWEGDWLLRGEAGAPWNPPPADAPALCERMARWMAARQAGVNRARAAFPGARARLVNAIELNRVWDAERGIPTVMDRVLPQVEVDLVSYSAYDSLESPDRLRAALREIRRHARTARGPLGAGAVMLGEIGIPEHDQPERIAERWDGFLGVARDLDLPWTFVWQLYCNEPAKDSAAKPPVKGNRDVRGFMLVRPDGSLSESGALFSRRWRG